MNTVRMNRINLLLFFLTWLGGIQFAVCRSLTAKIPASFFFLLLGIVNYVYAAKRPGISRGYPRTMVLALLLGFVADIALELDFLIGAALFALGHVVFLMAFRRLAPLKLRDFGIILPLALGCMAIVLFLPVLDFSSGFMQGIVLVYALIISLMLGKAVSNYRRIPGTVTKAVLIGSCLFFFSDLMLLFAFFTDVGRIANILCLNTYYPGQAILAGSVFLFAETEV